MNITLYKNCRINNKYDILYNKGYHLNTYNTDAHTYYLSTLGQVTFTIDDIYLNDSGRLELDLYDTTNTAFLNQYNYMKFEIQNSSGVTDYDSPIARGSYVCDSHNTLTRYAFITRIQYTTDTITVDYECDVFHSYVRNISDCYARLIRFNDTTIQRLSDASTITPLEELGDLKYISQSNLLNHEIDISGGFYSNGVINKSADKDCYCFLEIQYYDSAGSGDTSSRISDTVLLGYNSGSNDVIDNFVTSSKNWENMLTYLKVYSSDANGKTTLMDKYYEIMNVYLFPRDNNTGDALAERIEDLYDETYGGFTALVFCVSDLVSVSVTASSGTTTTTYTKSHDFISLDRLCTYPYLRTENTTVSGSSLQSISTTIPLIDNWSCSGDFKRRGIGFYTHMFEIPKNNKSFNMSLYLSYDNFNIKFFMELNNEVIEVTDDLKLEIPISVDTADATQLAKINRTLNNRQINVDQATNAITGVTGGIMSGISGYKQAGPLGAVLNAVGAGASLANSMVSSNIDRERNNIQSYTTNAGTRCSSVGAINARMGIIDFVEQPINEDEVALDIRRHGYKLNLNMQYQPDTALFYCLERSSSALIPYLQFDSIHITGEFSNEIRSKLEEIYTKGFRLVTRAQVGNETTYI